MKQQCVIELGPRACTHSECVHSPDQKSLSGDGGVRWGRTHSVNVFMGMQICIFLLTVCFHCDWIRFFILTGRGRTGGGGVGWGGCIVTVSEDTS